MYSKASIDMGYVKARTTLTLQVLGLEVDPAKEEVRPSRPFALGLMRVPPRREERIRPLGHHKEAGSLSRLGRARQPLFSRIEIRMDGRVV